MVLKKQFRGSLTVTFDILNTLKECNDLRNTQITRKANISHRDLMKHLDRLKKAEWISETNIVPESTGGRKPRVPIFEYNITGKGIEAVDVITDFIKYMSPLRYLF